MANFAYLFDLDNEVFKAVDSVALDASPTDSELPVENAIELPVSLPWRTQDATGAKYLELDFGIAVDVDTLAVVNHNVTAGATVFRFRAGATSPPTEVTFDLNADGPGTSAHFASSTTSKRYWRLEITDSANPDGWIEAGYIVLGVRSEWSFSFLNEWTRTRQIANRRSGPAGLSVAIVGELLNDSHRVTLAFENLHQAEWEELEDFIDACSGARNPLLFAPDPDDLRNVYFGRLESPQDLELTRKNKGFSNVEELILTEDNKGVRILATA